MSLAATTWISKTRDHRARRRDVFSKAFAAVVFYAEFPYVVRRRRADAPEEERIRISEELRKVQQDLAYYEAWLRTESPEVAEAFGQLVSETRRVAGESIHDGWKAAPPTEDQQMNMPDLGLGALMPFRERYLEAVTKDLAPFRSRFTAQKRRRPSASG